MFLKLLKPIHKQGCSYLKNQLILGGNRGEIKPELYSN